MLFDTLDTVVTFMRKASTSTGLRTTVNVIRRHYETGRKATAQMKQNLRIVFDNLLPKWNYRAIPQDATVIRTCRKTLLRQWGPLGLLLSLSGSCVWGFLPAPMSLLLPC
jgi:hypothetical protein